MDKNNVSYKTSKGLAVISFFINFIIITILVSDYIKTRSYHPLTNPAITALLKELDKNPDNEKLKTQIRELDYISRNLFFTDKAQIKKGGVLLSVFLTCRAMILPMLNFFHNACQKIILPCSSASMISTSSESE